MNAQTVRAIQLTMAIAALKRIRRKQAGFVHGFDPRNTCDCPQCIAKAALEQIETEESLIGVKE